jgi:hypothetical protein
VAGFDSTRDTLGRRAGIARLAGGSQTFRHEWRMPCATQSFESVGATVLDLRLEPIEPAQLAGLFRQVLALLICPPVNRTDSVPQSNVDREAASLALRAKPLNNSLAVNCLFAASFLVALIRSMVSARIKARLVSSSLPRATRAKHPPTSV